jgi:hypothetical protein
MSSKIFGICLHLSIKRIGSSIYLKIIFKIKIFKKLKLKCSRRSFQLKVGWLNKKGLVMDESNYFKLKHLDKLSSLDALNWPINVSNSCKFIQIKLSQAKLLECI